MVELLQSNRPDDLSLLLVGNLRLHGMIDTFICIVGKMFAYMGTTAAQN